MNRSRNQDWDRRRDEERRQQQRDRAGQIERRQEADRRRGQELPMLDRVRDHAKIKQLENQWRKIERDHQHDDPEWSHAFDRHVDITEQQLARRAATGELPNGEMRHQPPNATKWRSADAMVVAAHRLKHSDEYERMRRQAEANGEDRFAVTKPASEVLGPGWRADVHGRTAASGGALLSQWNDDSQVVGRWRRQSDGKWHCLTCFPQPGD